LLDLDGGAPPPTTRRTARGTWELVRERFVYQEGNPRPVTVAGVGTVDTWDVLGRKS
jgi:hypothetical protein